MGDIQGEILTAVRDQELPIVKELYPEVVGVRSSDWRPHLVEGRPLSVPRTGEDEGHTGRPSSPVDTNQDLPTERADGGEACEGSKAVAFGSLLRLLAQALSLSGDAIDHGHIGL